jgi:serine/threonine protein kinase
MEQAEALQAKLDHPNIIKYEEIFEDIHYVYFVMELA